MTYFRIIHCVVWSHDGISNLLFKHRNLFILTLDFVSQLLDLHLCKQGPWGLIFLVHHKQIVEKEYLKLFLLGIFSSLLRQSLQGTRMKCYFSRQNLLLFPQKINLINCFDSSLQQTGHRTLDLYAKHSHQQNWIKICKLRII